MSTATEPTLNEMLKSMGYYTKPAPEHGYGSKHVCMAGIVWFTGDAYEVMAWAKKLYEAGK